MLVAHYDEETGIVVTTANGLSSKADFDHYVSVLEGLMARSIARHGEWLHLVDASDNPVQSKDSTDHVADRWNAKPRLDGYTAYLLQSVLVKMQIRRMRENARSGFFADRAEAMAWLLSQVTTVQTPAVR